MAGDVQALLRASGRSRQRFAQAIGTSRRMLSTYASGKVAPAATLLVQMRMAARNGSRDEAIPSQRCTAGRRTPAADRPDPAVVIRTAAAATVDRHQRPAPRDNQLTTSGQSKG